jgi:PAS domain S-box-containing protein
MEDMASYEYNGHLWPSIVTTALIALLAVYGWRHRRVPGATPFTVACLFAVAWSAGALFQVAATDVGAKIAWLRFETLWQLPLVTAATCFVLEYAGLKRWLSRPVLALLSFPPLLFAALIVTNGAHALVWTGFIPGDTPLPVAGPANTTALAYSYALALFNLGVLTWLAVGSPRRRWPALMMIAGQLGARALHTLSTEGPFATRWEADPFVLLAVFGLYAVALFGFHALDPVPESRRAAVAQMIEGLVVLDPEGRIIDANPAAERALARRVGDLRGRPANEVLADAGREGEPVPVGERREVELDAGGEGPRRYVVHVSPLTDRRGRDLGRLLLLRDVTDEREAQARLLEQQRALSALRERERLARELHDTVGQVLGYVNLQAQTAGKKLADGDAEAAGALLDRLADVARHAHADVRESILALSATPSGGWSFLPALRRYLDEVGRDYAVRTELSVPPGMTEDPLRPDIAVQVLRVVQEAVTNVRRHAGDCAVRVIVEQDDGALHVTVTDDGRGFIAVPADAGHDGHFGIAFMRERMREVGGSVDIVSLPGHGTSVSLTVAALPRQEGEEG